MHLTYLCQTAQRKSNNFPLLINDTFEVFQEGQEHKLLEINSCCLQENVISK